MSLKIGNQHSPSNVWIWAELLTVFGKNGHGKYKAVNSLQEQGMFSEVDVTVGVRTTAGGQ